MTDQIKATAAQVRAHYRATGHEVRISHDGHVEYRMEGYGGPWLEGRWVSEYRVDAECGVCLI